ncbi:hypothetical protein ASPCADRAFT_170266 [Aspergillus carbonarius ITEM 5010]|uniref:Uncharacterized protein n=1 Tax=Aspergillus carbonarius (strain ITEM 5010) TaxID=602072 RepID=A0A1R3RM35_ASPC5|nr:hypothetical protein ASPCADRAFT_170266 [Aspergillus carbonarius ITEM 5010]
MANSHPTTEPSTHASAYTAAQITIWLQHLRLPRAYRTYIANPSTFPQTFESLRTLMRCQISRFPFENLSVHYSPTHIVDIRPAILYDKLLGPNANGRGGYCLEVSIFFHHMLRGLGFQTYMTGARIRPRVDGVPGGEYSGIIHTTNIVHLPTGQKYSLDVGFGGDGPTTPLPLQTPSPPTQARILSNLGTQQIRLLQSHIPCQSPFLTLPNTAESEHHKFWIYQYRNKPMDEWNSFYCFSEMEFFEGDFEVVNLFACLRSPVHRGRVLVVRFLRGVDLVDLDFDLVGGVISRNSGGEEGLIEEGSGEVNIIGKVMLVDQVIKVNVGGKTRVVHEFDTEEGRVQALWKYFEIRLTEEEKEGIKGWDKELV